MTATPSRSRARYLLWYWGPVVVFMAVIFGVSSLNSVAIPGGFSDKVAHGGEYVVLGLLLGRAIAGPRWLSITFPYAAVTVVLAAVYGASDEFHQLFVPGRDFDVADMIADATGASIGVGALWLLGIIRRIR